MDPIVWDEVRWTGIGISFIRPPSHARDGKFKVSPR